MVFISNALGIAGLLLQVLLLGLLAKGPIARYFPLFLYVLTWTADTMAEGWVLREYGPSSSMYFNLYWGGELLLDSLLFFLVISLTLRALEGNPMRNSIVRFFVALCVVVLAIPFVAFHTPVFGRHWNQSVGQLLNFGAAAMNFGLWTALIANKQRDRQLLTVSAGLGLTVAGAALTLGVRQFTNQDDSLRIVADFVHRLTQIASPLIWCWAFWPHKWRKPRGTPFNVPEFKAPTRAAG